MNDKRWTPTATFKPMVPAARSTMPSTPKLPPAMAAHVKAGPIDEEGWTLLAANAAVSAKLRQLQPRIVAALAAKGIKVTAIRVRVASQ